jgi:hypothetical protein
MRSLFCCLFVLLLTLATAAADPPLAAIDAAADPSPTAHPDAYQEPTLAPYPAPGTPKAACADGSAAFPLIWIEVAPDLVTWWWDWDNPQCPWESAPPLPVSYDTHLALPLISR